MKIAVIIAALVLATVAFAADRIAGPTVSETFTHAKHMGDPPTILPAIYKLCSSVGIPRNSCITMPKYGATDISRYSLTETNKALWYIGESSSTDPVSDADCHDAVPIEHYVTWDGTLGTTYECLAQPEDDQITAADINAIRRAAEHLNSIGKKTLADHEKALQIKQMARYLASQP